MNTPLVSICCITYNHAPFIRKCLEGFLIQQLPTIAHNRPQSPTIAHNSQASWLEILIHDDCSTDGTTEIVKEYAAKYPDLIKPLYETENQYSKVGTAGIDMFNYSRAQGKYIAYCEGDDCWTDPLKLQKQMDWMEAHPDYSVCFHTFRNRIVTTDEYRETPPTQLLRAHGHPEGMDIGLDTYFEKWYTQPMTMLIRRDMFDLTWRNQYKYYRDQHEIYHLLKVGKCRLMNFDGGVRNVHGGGIASMIGNKKQMEVSQCVARELYKMNKDVATLEFYTITMQWILYSTKKWTSRRLYYSLLIYGLNHNFHKFVKNILR